MKRIPLSLPEIGLIGATRGALGAGVALLLVEHLLPGQHRAAGGTLFVVGAISTMLLLISLPGKHADAGDQQQTY